MTIGDNNIIATEGSQVATGGGVAAGGNVSDVTTTGGAAASEGGMAAAGGSSTADQAGAAGAGGSQVNVGLVERAKRSTWAKVCGVIFVVVTIITTALVVLKVWDLAWAGYVVAALAILVGVVPLFRDS